MKHQITHRLAILGAALLVPVAALSAGQLDPHLKKLRTQWKQQPSQLTARLVAGEAPMAVTGAVRVQGDEVKVATTISLSSVQVLESLGIRYTRVTPEIVTAEVPLSALEALEAAPSIRHIAMARQEEPHNSVNMAKMHMTVPYTAGYTGQNVLIGIIDSGIDVTHPAFKVGGTTSGASRIKYLWDQTQSHTPFSVGSFTSTKGRRWTDTEITAGQCNSTDTSGHGTHVAGSAAGYHAAFPANAGGAKNANLLFVKTTFNSTDILNGIVWLKEQAAQLGKPIVVNLSLGSKYGPHDGTDLDTKAIDDLVAGSNGNLIVLRSGGNYADDGHHDSATVGTTATALPVTISSYTPSASKSEGIAFMFYYDATKAVSLRIKDSAGNYSSWFAPSASILSGTLQDGALYEVGVGQDPEDYNPSIKNIYVYLGEDGLADGKHVRPGTYELEFKTADGQTRLDGWLYYTTSGAVPASFTSPDHDITLGNGACGNNILAVAAYVSRKSWSASDGKTYNYPSETQDQIATFSSIGPTRDNRQKPDITGGGSIVLSTLSAQAATPTAPFLPAEGGTYYQYMQGTSMSSPTVTGAVALLKERNPSWTYANMLNYFRTNSQGTTVHTTPGTWNKFWGWGVMDMLNMAQSVGVSVAPAGPVNVLPGATQAFRATVTNANSNTVNWTVSAGGGSVSPASTAGDGVASTTYTAPATVGTYTVTARSAEDTGASATVTVNVFNPASVTVTVSPSTKTLMAGGTHTFTASVANAPSGGTVTWSATGGSINTSGAYTAPTTPGTYTVTATSSWGASGTATVQVKTLDLNGDGAVDTLDVLQLTKRYGSTAPADLTLADLDGDGLVNDADLTLLKNAL